MRRRWFWALTLSASAAFAQEAAKAPVAAYPVVELKGKIERVQVTPGQGMPFLEVKDRDAVTKVMLGSMRYLMRENFNPKAGEPVEVRGYKMESLVVAISVTLPDENKTMKLRDENGFPVWMGGPHRYRSPRN